MHAHTLLPALLLFLSGSPASASPSPSPPDGLTVPLIRNNVHRSFETDDERASWAKELGAKLIHKYGAKPKKYGGNAKRANGYNLLTDSSRDS
jgi:hypothetical protein